LEINKKNLRHIFLGVAGCIVLYWLLHETDRVRGLFSTTIGMLSPFLVGAAIAFILNVPMRAIENGLKKISNAGARRALALILTIVGVAMVLYGVIYFLIPQITETVESLIGTLPGFFRRVEKSVTDYLAENPELLEWLSEYTDFTSINWSSLIEKAVTLATDGLGLLVDKAISTVISLSNGIFNGVLSVVFAIYCLIRKEILARQGRRILYSLLPESACDETIRILRMTNTTFSRFISGQCLEAVILGSMFAVCMSIFKMPYMPLISVIIAITALVPIVGAFVGCIIGAFFILVVDPVLAFWFVVMFLGLQQIEGNLIYPRVVGTSIGLPGMWVLVSVAIGGDLMGVGGMLIMIPLASVVYSLLREFTQRRLAKRGIPLEKLQDQAPDVISKFREKRQKAKAKKLWKKAPEKNEQDASEKTE
jgi:predicted PurR-regulated permease PerM